MQKARLPGLNDQVYIPYISIFGTEMAANIEEYRQS